ncbi:hypothetical protein [Croceimicrobium sp.]|uniref:hypothetical protein n=1 Tax=Croceimicrobium sp. TaxID=2828340 RepID=UPI003BA986B5
MSILLYLVLLFLCLRWLHGSQKTPGQMISISFSFMGGSLFSFAFSLMLDNEYLEGITHLILLSLFSVLFWLIGLVIIWKAKPEILRDTKIIASMIISLVLVLPILTYALLANANLKIGG